MQNYTAFVKAKYEAKPKMKRYYGSLERFQAHYFQTHRLQEWLDSLRGTAPSLGFINHMARVYVEKCERKPSELPAIFADLYRRYNIEIPAVEGILTPEYWEEKAAQFHWNLQGQGQAA